MSNEEQMLSGEALISAVRAQIEYYFSKENLQTDAFLNSLMDSQNSVPLSAVMKFAKLKSLTQEEDIVIQAISESTVVSVSDGRIKSNAKTGRFTIILRDIPSDADESEIREIFAYEDCKPITSIRSELGDNWFITMETEEDAKDTLLDLRLKKRTFRGNAVKGRLKSEPAVRSFYPIINSSLPSPSSLLSNGMISPMVSPMGMYGYNMMPTDINTIPMFPPSSNNEYDGNVIKSNDEVSEVVEEVVKDIVNASVVSNKTNTSTTTTASVSNGASSSSRATSSSQPKDSRRHNSSNGSSSNSRSSNTGSSGSAGGKRSNNSKPSSSSDPLSRPVIDTSPLHFPPLSQSSDGLPVPPTPGYKTSFIKYTADELVAIVETITEASLPPSLSPAHHNTAMEHTPNLDLLLRQRTFSMDETRELLQQGRPIQREAILTGAVDVRTLIYGETEGDEVSEAGVEEKKRPAAGGSWAAIAKAAGDTPVSAVTASGGSSRLIPAKKIPSKDKSESKKSEVGPKKGGLDDQGRGGGEEGGRGRDKRGGDGGGRKRDGGSKGAPKDKPEVEEEVQQQQQSAAVPHSSWGGKPTFANVLLKQQQEMKETQSSTSTGTQSIMSVSSSEHKEEASDDSLPESTSVQTESRSREREGIDADVWTKENLHSLPPRKHNSSSTNNGNKSGSGGGDRLNKKMDS